MSEARIGRLLVASLHQAIADVLPDRLEFYENWLNARGLRRGTIGLAAISAVLSFLRSEGDVYEDIVARAGAHAADWTLLGKGRARRALILTLPRAIRARMALSLTRRVIRETYADSRAITRIRSGIARVDLRGSLFCEVREPGDRMLCGFYLALAQRLLDRYNISSRGSMVACRGAGHRSCALTIRLGAGTGQPATAIAGLLMVLFASAGVAAQTATPPRNPASPQTAAPASDRLLVVPFENTERDAGLYWLTEGAAILLTDSLNEQGGNAITRADRVRAFDTSHLPEANVLSRATVIKVGQLVGAGRVVVGEIRRGSRGDTPGPGDDLVVRARWVRLDTGRLEPEITERAALTDLFDLFQRVAARLLGRAPKPVAAGDRAPLEAFENYVKGLIAENSEAKVRYLEAALQGHPAYDRAHLAMWEARSDRGEYAQALAAARAVHESSPFSRRARFAAALSLMDLKRYDEAFEALKRLNDEQPAAAVENDLGVVQIRRGWTTHSGKPAYFFDRAVAADPYNADLYFNLGYAYALDNDPQAAIYWLRESLRRNPADAEAHLVLGIVLQGSGNNAVEAQRELELARQLSASYEKLAGPASERKVPGGLERPSRRLEPFRSSVAEAIATPAQRDQREMAAFHLDRARRLVDQERYREAEMELRRAVYLSPYNADAHLLLGRVYFRTGRVTDAIGALKISIWSQDTAPARVALGEAYLRSGDRAAAKEQAERALVLAPGSAEAKALLARVP